MVDGARRWGAVLVLSGVACLLPGGAHAQQTDGSKGNQISWHGQGLRYAGCLQFLVSPDKVGDLLDAGWQPLPADADSALQPALRHAIESESQYAQWTPGQVCVLRFDGMGAAGHAESGKQPGEGQLIVLVAVAGTAKNGSGARMQATSVQTSDWRLAEASRSYRLRLEDTDARFSRLSETSGERLTLKIRGATLAWDGLSPPAAASAAGDSSSAAGGESPGPVTWHWGLAGTQKGHWSLACRLAPTVRRPYSGAVSVSGKSDLAKALRGSPILFVGPIYGGGAAELDFQR